MTHNGYSFKRPTLNSNYIQLLSTIQHLNDCGHFPTRKQLFHAVPWDVKDAWNYGRGFRKIVQNLTDKGYVKEDKGGGLECTYRGDDLLFAAADRTATSYYERA